MFDVPRLMRTALAALLLLSTGATTANVPELRDPTRPLRSPVSPGVPAVDRQAHERPSLDSVLIGGGRRVAVINGHRMTVGDERHGVKVLEIRADGVVVSVDGSQRMTLEIRNSRMHKELR